MEDRTYERLESVGRAALMIVEAGLRLIVCVLEAALSALIWAAGTAVQDPKD